MAKRSQTKPVCKSCRKPSRHLGAISGTCPACQNQSVSELEQMTGLKPGELGRVDKFGNVRDDR